MHVTVLAVFSFVLHCLIIWEENENSFNGIEGYQWNKQRMDPYEPGQLNPDTMKITCDLEVCDKRIQHGRGGIVRRDLKLENILVKSSDINEVNEVKLNVKPMKLSVPVTTANSVTFGAQVSLCTCSSLEEKLLN
ncbi:serine/threonine-protein kinase 33 isoform X4 [Aphelocoma coerulescens]|uniref:serine/threonine-protein kinase 33 isoform X4 n=1 Tax=Aphelocoma coerulescens TaxID=39617 RepID=UPI00360466D9